MDDIRLPQGQVKSGCPHFLEILPDLKIVIKNSDVCKNGICYIVLQLFAFVCIVANVLVLVFGLASPFQVIVTDLNDFAVSGPGLFLSQIFKETFLDIDLRGNCDSLLNIHITGNKFSLFFTYDIYIYIVLRLYSL